MANTGTTASAATKSYNGLTVGDKVNCNGYCMRVTRLIDWDNQLIECSNGSGETCVDSNKVYKLSAKECDAYSLGNKIV